MTLDPKLLKDVQAAGWLVTSASQEAVIGTCRREGCGFKGSFKAGKKVPSTALVGPGDQEKVVDGFDDAREFLGARRRSLGLTIAEVEEISGMAQDYLAKFEKDNPSKYPNAITFIEWAQGLGYAVVLRPAELSPLALRVISETRARADARAKMQPYYAARRLSAAD